MVDCSGRKRTVKIQDDQLVLTPARCLIPCSRIPAWTWIGRTRASRPIKDKQLAKSGTGGDLPTYVGALPPEGVQAWDWQKTWNARMRKSPEKKGKLGKE
jgi:hypothetical protein